jgi:hypothetical protein
VNIFGGGKDWLCETRERCEQSFCAGAAGGCVGRAPGARPSTDWETAAATVAIAPPHGVGYLRILLTHGSSNLHSRADSDYVLKKIHFNLARFGVLTWLFLRIQIFLDVSLGGLLPTFRTTVVGLENWDTAFIPNAWKLRPTMQPWIPDALNLHSRPQTHLLSVDCAM